MTNPTHSLVLENHHTGERLELCRVARDGDAVLTRRATLPPRSQGPPLHVHTRQVEKGRVLAGTLSAEIDGRQIQVPAGGAGTFPAGSAHRWWNDGDELLRFEGTAIHRWCSSRHAASRRSSCQ